MSSAASYSIATAIRRHAPRAVGAESHLEAALAQVIDHPGKLLRAQLAAAGARHHGLPTGKALRLACAIEYFHTASLIFDDLPCMDDATVRRGLPCVHRRHGEATAILTALALITRAYALVAEALAQQPQRVRAEITACLDRCLGVAGLVGGQAWDLGFSQSASSPRQVGRIALGKTGALFELALLLPAAMARPSPGEQRALRALCVYWGQIFQISDDLHDELSSSFTTGKSPGRDRILARPNLALVIGASRARSRLERLRAQSHRTLSALLASSPDRWGYLQSAAEAVARVTTPPAEAHHVAA